MSHLVLKNALQVVAFDYYTTCTDYLVYYSLWLRIDIAIMTYTSNCIILNKD